MYSVARWPSSFSLSFTLGAFQILLLGCLALTATPTVQAFSGQQTDQAFAALLSMSGAGPEQGTWKFPPAEDFEGDTEAALVGYLARKQKAGADFNAYRHLGTLLHHAIRADMVATAKWLLAHGADPRKTVLQGGQDALGLSVTYKRNELVRLLQTQYGMAQPAPRKNLLAQSSTRTEIASQPEPQPQQELLRLVQGSRQQKDGKTHYGTPADAWRAFWRKQASPIEYGFLNYRLGRGYPA